MNGVSASNVVGFTYDALATGRLAQIRTMMDAVITAETNMLVPSLKALVIIYIGLQFTLAYLGHLTVRRFVMASCRALTVILLIAHHGQFIKQVRDPAFDTIPTAISNTVLTSAGVQANTSGSPAQQFDNVSLAVDAVTAGILSLNTGFSIAAAVNYLAAWLANGGIQWMLAIIVAIWLLGQGLLAIVLCFGPGVLMFELFDRTRGFVDQWIGKLVGLTCFGFGTSILLALQMTELMSTLRTLNGNMPTSAVQAVAALFRVGENVVLDLVTMASLPLVCAIGSGVAASLAAPSAMLAFRGMGGPLSSVPSAAAHALRIGARSGRAARNALSAG